MIKQERNGGRVEGRPESQQHTRVTEINSDFVQSVTREKQIGDENGGKGVMRKALSPPGVLKCQLPQLP